MVVILISDIREWMALAVAIVAKLAEPSPSFGFFCEAPPSMPIALMRFLFVTTCSLWLLQWDRRHDRLCPA